MMFIAICIIYKCNIEYILFYFVAQLAIFRSIFVAIAMSTIRSLLIVCHTLVFTLIVII